MLLDFLLSAGIDILEFGAHPTRALFCGGREMDAALRRQLERMEAQGLIAREESSTRAKWVVSVTQLGKDEATQQIDPEIAWSREWDGVWRMLVFDLPAGARGPRQELNRWLRKRRFGGLQGSAWISPSFPQAWSDEIAAMRIRPSDISFFQGKSFGRSSDVGFVSEAWNFAAINERYATYLDFLGRSEPELSQKWLETESSIWLAAFDRDPFLPNSLLPNPYLGKSAYAGRRKAYAKLGELARSLR